MAVRALRAGVDELTVHRALRAIQYTGDLRCVTAVRRLLDAETWEGHPKLDRVLEQLTGSEDWEAWLREHRDELPPQLDGS